MRRQVLRPQLHAALEEAELTTAEETEQGLLLEGHWGREEGTFWKDGNVLHPGQIRPSEPKLTFRATQVIA